MNALVLLAQEVLNWHLDVVKCDVRRCGRLRVGRLDLFCLDTLTPGNKKNAESLACIHSGDKVVTPYTVGDPLLSAIHDVVLAIGGLDGRRPQVRDVTTGKS